MSTKEIKFDKQFLKNLRKRFVGNKQLEEKIAERINLFLTYRKSPILRDHALLGAYEGMRSFSVTGDTRVIYIEYEDFYLFIDIGTHNQIYGK